MKINRKGEEHSIINFSRKACLFYIIHNKKNMGIIFNIYKELNKKNTLGKSVFFLHHRHFIIFKHECYGSSFSFFNQ